MPVIKNLHFKLGRFSLDIDRLEWADTGVTALRGVSGAGKTTLLNVLIGFHQPQAWEWHFKGEDLSRLAVSDRRLGVVFQGYDLFPHLSAEENILLVLNSRHEKKERETALRQLQVYKKQLQLEACWNTKAENLSGGEKQRVALLRAVISNPRMLLLDEPFSALDENLRDEARLLTKNFISQVNLPVLLITHDENDVRLLANHSLNISNGRII